MKILYVTTISLTMNSFFKPHVEMLVKEGNQVDIACNSSDLPLDELYNEWKCEFFQIDFSRSPLSMNNVRAYGQLKKVIEKGNYDIVHCHTPNASVITRLVCQPYRKKNGLKVFYTAHGFHFYKGAPKLNWMVFYPVEKFCSRFTDKLITINQEDYALAKKRFKAKEVYYIPGVGIDLSKFENIQVDRNAKRREIGVPEDAFLLLSVGELNDNKNHQVIIKAMGKLKNFNIHYAIAGVGDERNHLIELANDLGVSEQLHLLGYRKDIAELNYSADVFCFPSKREGLGLAAIEAMACGLPLITSNVHGINDYSKNGVTGYKCSADDADTISDIIDILFKNIEQCRSLGKKNKQAVRKYSLSQILEKIEALYD